MKKFLLLLAVAIAATSCSTLVNTSTHKEFNVNTPYAVPIVADLDISKTKVMYTYIPPKSIQRGGQRNVVNTAVREALVANGNADVMVGLETQISYNFFRKITSIVITGYPAKYKNFRNLKEEVWYEIPYFQTNHEKRTFVLRK